MSCGAHGWCEAGACSCDVGFSGPHCETSDLGAALTLGGGVSGHSSGAAIVGAALGVIGVAAAAKRMHGAFVGGGVGAGADLSAPLASEV